jgi:hypothetical protein
MLLQMLLNGTEAAIGALLRRSVSPSTARLGVLAPKLAYSLADFGNFVLRPKPDEVYIVDGAGCHHGTGMAGAALGSGTSKITRTPGPSEAVLYIESSFPPAVGPRLVHNAVEGFWCVLPCHTKYMVTFLLSENVQVTKAQDLFRAQQNRRS